MPHGPLYQLDVAQLRVYLLRHSFMNKVDTSTRRGFSFSTISSLRVLSSDLPMTSLALRAAPCPKLPSEFG